MKISYMLKREDFYSVNKKTLEKFYQNEEKEVKLYVYPSLNAIVTRRPSKAVKRYLYTEYHVRGSFIKKLCAFIYTRIALNFGGLFASKKLKIKATADKNTLIYPCNKKYRIFDFALGKVSVIVKDGFPDGGINNEIEFRKSVKENFIHPIEISGRRKYCEKIIDGYPLARADKYAELLDLSWNMWREYTKKYDEHVPATKYSKLLKVKADTMISELKEKGKSVNAENTFKLVDYLTDKICGYGEDIIVTLSHGDLQSGNVWVENNTEKIIIIDWESVGRRSVWYDWATLTDDIRKEVGIYALVDKEGLASYTVIFEDVIFRLNELMQLPFDYNTENFNVFVYKMTEKLKIV